MAALRHKGDQCDRLGIGRTRHRAKHYGQSIAFYDDQFRLLDRSQISEVRGSRLLHVGGFDMRILDNGKFILATFRIEGEWFMRTLHLGRERDGALEAWFGEREGYKTGTIEDLIYQHEKNIGLMLHNGRLSLLWGLSGSLNITMVDHRMRITPVQGLNGDVMLHNSINPIWLPEEDLFLTVGHAHLHDNDKAGEIPDTVPKFGYNYVQTFVLFEPNPPYNVQNISPTFCLPSGDHQCEIIQFIMGMDRVGDDLLISYGINDCEGAVIKVSLSDALHFSRSGERASPTVE